MTPSILLRNTIVFAFVMGAFISMGAASADAAPRSFDQSYSYGVMGSAGVADLQIFLTEQGFYSGPITGNYLNMTTAAVASFQRSQGISPIGIFGPLTRAAASQIAGGVGRIASLTLLDPVTGDVEMGATQVVKWTSHNYPSSQVSVRLIREVSTSPHRYELVRTISAATPNDGSATWVPAASDIGSGLAIEIGCTTTAQACAAVASVDSDLAVIRSTRYSNAASAFKAIEAAENK